MAFRTWGRLLLTALGVSLLAGAGQLGVAFGFGIVRLDGSFTGGSVNQWPAQLVWAGWFAANAAVAGAVLTERLARRDGLLTGTVRPVAVAAAAALGATVVAPLCMQPARAAELISVDPVWAVAICATAGAVVGAGAATAVLMRPPVGWNMALVATVVWVLALVSAAPALISTGELSTVRLGVLEPSWLDPDAAQRLSMVVLPLVALLAGAATGGLARWRGHPPLVSGTTGVAGPALLAFAYLTAGPGDVVDRYQATPYYGALIAVAVGALGSAAAALLRWPLVPARTASTAIEPTEVLRALPAGPALPSTAASARTSADGRSTDITLTGPWGDDPDPTGRTAAEVRDHDSGTPLAAPVRPGGSGPAVPVHWDWPAATSAPPPATRPVTADRTGNTVEAARPVEVSEGDDATRRSTTSAEAVPTAPADRATDAPAPTPTATADDHTAATRAAAPQAAAPQAAATRAAAPQAGTTAAGTTAAGTTAAGTLDEAATPPAVPGSMTRPRRPRSTPASSDTTTPAPVAEAVVEPTGTSGDQAVPLPAGPSGDQAVPLPAGPSGDQTTPLPAGRASEPGAKSSAPVVPPTGAAMPAVSPTRTDPPARATGDGSPEPAPRPRHRAPLPDLNRAAIWDAFATARRAGPQTTTAPAPTSGPPSTTGPTPATGTPTASGTTTAGSAGNTAGPTDIAGTAPTSTAGPASTAPTSTAGTALASTVGDPTLDGSPPSTGSEQPAGRGRGRRGLFRRGKARADQNAAATADQTEQLPAQDEEFVDWVAGLSKPLPDNEPEQESGRRSLRSSGRHHRD